MREPQGTRGGVHLGHFVGLPKLEDLQIASFSVRFCHFMGLATFLAGDLLYATNDLIASF
ncbi:MAG: hypothetical protein AAF616_12840 [Bacteroidota bacterium]